MRGEHMCMCMRVCHASHYEVACPMSWLDSPACGCCVGPQSMQRVLHHLVAPRPGPQVRGWSSRVHNGVFCRLFCDAVLRWAEALPLAVTAALPEVPDGVS